MLRSAHLVLLLALMLGVVSIVLGLRASRNIRHSILRQEAWPAFVESVVSALSAGLSATEALETCCLKANKSLQPVFKGFLSDLQRKRLQDALPSLREAGAIGHIDEFVKLLTVNETLGGIGLIQVLKSHSKTARTLNASSAQVRAKRSATLTVAKLGVAAPWVLLSLLLNRPETADSFSSSLGVSILLAGLAVCLLAYRMIVILGATPNEVRVYG